MLNPEQDPLRHDMMEGGDKYESLSKEMLEITQRYFPLSPSPQSLFSDEHFNNAMLMGDVFNYYASGSINAARNELESSGVFPGLIQKMDMPSDEWVRRIFAGMEAGASLSAFDKEVGRIIGRLREKGINISVWDLAIDMHLIPRYDKKPNPELVKSKAKAGTWLFERYITIQVIVPGMRLVLGSLRMPALEDTGVYVGMLLDRVKKLGINIGVVMADREFFSVKVLQTIVSRGIKYLMPCRNTGGVTRAIEEFARNERGRVSEMYLTAATSGLHIMQ